ncbi:MAG: sulfotransferase domain-containing protein [Alphaproteobacteria bacterium]|nr:sulfotransferase domain-containing protein [Alphaproteobacteria bacterium]
MGAIIWLASYPKSGNTWLRAFLHNLLRNPDHSFDINNLTAFSLGDSDPLLYQRLDPRPPNQLSNEEIARLRPKVQSLMTGVSPDNVFVKTHNALVEDFGVPMISLDVTAGAIYVVRNPLDVVISYSHHLGWTIDQTIDLMAASAARTPSGLKFVTEKICSWSVNVESWTTRPNRTLHVVRYEDMHAEPIKTFGAIAGFLGLKPPRERLERAIRHSSFKVLQEQEKRHGFIERSPMAERFFRQGKAGQWRSVLSDAQVQRIITDHAGQMDRFGYRVGVAA